MRCHPGVRIGSKTFDVQLVDYGAMRVAGCDRIAPIEALWHARQHTQRRFAVVRPWLAGRVSREVLWEVNDRGKRIEQDFLCIKTMTLLLIG
jgi:hypothetical protein